MAEKTKVVLIPGDGIGPEITEAVVGILDRAGAKILWETHEAGASVCHAPGDDPLPDSVIAAVRSARVALKAPIATPIGGGFASVNVRLRKTLDLYANLRPVRTLYPGIGRYEDVDVVVVRENTEGLYSGIEHEVIPGVVESLKIVTEKACRRISRFAFDYARAHQRKRVTAVHKANIMKLADGLFLRVFDEVSAEYPEIIADECIVDAACMKLVLDPANFDVVVMENLYGDILSDLCSGLVGGLGVTAGANIGASCAVFEAVHGSAPDIAGQNIANPTALLLSATLMLDHLHQEAIAQRIRSALHQTLAQGKRTADLGGELSTSAFAEAIRSNL